MITINDLNKTIKTKEQGANHVVCGRCAGENISNDKEDVSPGYVAACLDCDEDMFLIELRYKDSNNQLQHLTQDGFQINEVNWTCHQCGHANDDLMKETSSPMCGGCGKTFEWSDINIDVGTFFGGEETQVKLSELVFIDKTIADSGVELTKQNVQASDFTTLIPDDKLAAYFGSFEEYVPINFS